MTQDDRAVFVVHGRNRALADAMFDFLRSIDLAPMEWDQAVQLTATGSPYVGQILDAAFERVAAVVVLLTPDEVAYLQPRYGDGVHDVETQPTEQARPNVLFEAGLAFGRHPDRTVLVEIGDVRPFSDVGGRHVIRLNNSPTSRQALATRLRTAGCAVNLTGTHWHSRGDFTAPTPAGDGLVLGRRIPARGTQRPPVDFDIKYVSNGGNRFDKLQVINRGTETAYDVTLSIPEGTSLDLQRAAPIAKIPGGGKSVTVNVLSLNRYLGGADTIDQFDITVTARSDADGTVTQDVFIDMNG